MKKMGRVSPLMNVQHVRDLVMLACPHLLEKDPQQKVPSFDFSDKIQVELVSWVRLGCWIYARQHKVRLLD